MIEIGQVIYGNHSNNNRYYDRDGNRQYMNLPTGWEPYTVTGETKQSWIVNNSIKVDKRTLIQRNTNYGPIKFISTLGEIEQQEFVKNSYKLAERVRDCSNYEKLKRIEAILQEEN